MNKTIRLLSTGKSAVLSGQINADLYVDCRVIRNPHRDPAIGHLNGDDPKVQAWLVKENFAFLRAVLTLIKLGLETAPSRNSFREAGNGSALVLEGSSGKPFTVAFFCLAGVHRSRGSKNVIASMLKSDEALKGWEVEVIK